jgi:MFS family permease
MFGWAQGFSSGVGAVSTILAGVLAAYDWRLIFWIYAIFILILALQFGYLPKMPPVDTPDGEPGAAPAKVKVSYTTKQYIKLACVLLYAICMMLFSVVITLKLSFIVMERQLGDPTLAGVGQSLSGVVAVFAALFYGVLSRKLGRYLMVVLPFVLLIDCLVFFYADSPALIIVAAAINGISSGLLPPLYYEKATAIGPPPNSAFAAGLVNGIVGLALFFGAFIEVFYGLFVEATTSNLFLCAAVSFAVVVVVMLLYAVFNPFKGVNYVSETKPEELPT